MSDFAETSYPCEALIGPQQGDVVHTTWPEAIRNLESNVFSESLPLPFRLQKVCRDCIVPFLLGIPTTASIADNKRVSHS